jgi:predicted PurR-regulated permease PerM
MPSVTEPRAAPTFLHRLLVVTLSVLLVVMLLHLARELRTILQPLFIAFFLGYLILPAHAWLVKQGISRNLARVVFLVVVMTLLFLLGTLVYRNVEAATARLPHYEERLRNLLERGISYLPVERAEVEEFLHELPMFQRNSAERLAQTMQATLGPFVDFVTWMFIVFIYLVFVSAERVMFPQRVRLALGDEQGARVLAVIDSINRAISEYIAVKTLVSVIAGVASYVVLALFGVDFAAMWGILIFLLNYIPYLGSLVAVSLPILLSFVQLEELWKGIVIAVLLVAIQQGIGMVVEPRMAGQRLGVSPLLILLSLAFWGLVWGIVGMILAVPLLVTVKIILDNIRETKPLATLISNV